MKLDKLLLLKGKGEARIGLDVMTNQVCQPALPQLYMANRSYMQLFVTCVVIYTHIIVRMLLLPNSMAYAITV